MDYTKIKTIRDKEPDFARSPARYLLYRMADASAWPLPEAVKELRLAIRWGVIPFRVATGILSTVQLAHSALNHPVKLS